MENWMLLVSLLFLLVSVLAHPKGPPVDACVSMFPTGHGYDAMDATNSSTNPGFKITPNSTTYSPNDTITVEISGSGQYYAGVFIQARVASCVSNVNDQAQGMFTLESGETMLKTMTCGPGTNNAVSHNSPVKKDNNTFTWTAPSGDVGTIYFRGTFVVETEQFWTTISSDFVMSPSNNSTEEKCSVQTMLPPTPTMSTTTVKPSSGLSLASSSLGFLLCTLSSLFIQH